MFLTKLLLNPLSRQVLRDLANPYDLHRSLLSGFPDAAEGGPGRVLFRVERPQKCAWYDDQPPAPIVLLQSEHAPNWQTSGLHRDYFRERFPPKPLPQSYEAGTRLRFRLRANPTTKRDGKRHGLFDEVAQLGWLHRKAEASGFQVMGVAVVPEGNSRGTKFNDSRHDITHFAVQFDGELLVRNQIAFAEAIKNGIGSAKGFGFGLLSLARG